MATSRPNVDNITWFDVKGKPNGNYANPKDCTRYIAVTGGHVTDMACPDCDPNNHLSAGKPYMVWDDDAKQCEWPASVTCISDPPEQ